ncbi:MAG: hypothetical protein MSA15_07250 [Clostridium sp.]|nr:hypothetical protein [Clostridium sp.]
MGINSYSIEPLRAPFGTAYGFKTLVNMHNTMEKFLSQFNFFKRVDSNGDRSDVSNPTGNAWHLIDIYTIEYPNYEESKYIAFTYSKNNADSNANYNSVVYTMNIFITDNKEQKDFYGNDYYTNFNINGKFSQLSDRIEITFEKRDKNLHGELSILSNTFFPFVIAARPHEHFGIGICTVNEKKLLFGYNTQTVQGSQCGQYVIYRAEKDNLFIYDPLSPFYCACNLPLDCGSALIYPCMPSYTSIQDFGASSTLQKAKLQSSEVVDGMLWVLGDKNVDKSKRINLDNIFYYDIGRYSKLKRLFMRISD